MPEQYHDPILQFLASTEGAIRVAELAERLNISVADRAAFEQAVDALAKAGRVVWGEGRMIALPALGSRVTGIFRQTSRGFGFVIPDEANAHGDLFIPAGENLDAVTGDYVVATVVVREKYDNRDPKKSISGRIIEILRRATNRCVGVLTQDHGRWLVLPDGNIFKAAIEVKDVTAKSATEGDKVVVELLRFPGADVQAQGVIMEVLGQHGEPEVEQESVIRQFDLPGPFPPEVVEQARMAAANYNPPSDPAMLTEREDLSDQVIATIDPDDARDFDDAISLRVLTGGGGVTKGRKAARSEESGTTGELDDAAALMDAAVRTGAGAGGGMIGRCGSWGCISRMCRRLCRCSHRWISRRGRGVTRRIFRGM